jgi:hypothetical protein
MTPAQIAEAETLAREWNPVALLAAFSYHSCALA